MEIYLKDRLELPRRAPFIVSCQTHLYDYLDISCEPPNSFYKGTSNNYFLLFSIRLSKANCVTFEKFLVEHGSTTFNVTYQATPRNRKRRQALAAIGVPVILAGGTSYITNKFMEKKEEAEIERVRQTIKLSNLQQEDLINLVKSNFDKVDLEFDHVYEKFEEETTKQCQELGMLSDRMFLEVVNDLFTYYRLTVMSFLTDIPSNATIWKFFFQLISPKTTN